MPNNGKRFYTLKRMMGILLALSVVILSACGTAGTVTFSVSGIGTYTFYTADSEGDETVQAVSVPHSTQDRSMQSGRDRMGNMLSGVPAPIWRRST